jgi:outer membrane protein assembly factor BamA
MGRITDVDRTGREYSISDKRAFGDWTNIAYQHGIFDDGSSEAFTLSRPFYALDTRWAAGVAASKNERTNSIYDSGNIIGQYDQKSELGEIYGGWSRGLVDNWTHRYSVGIQYQNDDYATDPGLLPPPPGQLPPDLKLVGPFFRHEAVEGDFIKTKNRDSIERVEDFALGFHSLVQLGRATTALGSTRDLWLYSASVSDGFTFSRADNLLVSAKTNGRYGSEGGEHQFYGATGKYYKQQAGRGLFFTSISADTVANGNASDQFTLGGDTGLRGYPLRYQSGTHRVLLSLEQRAYTDWYPYRLFRMGGAIFYDFGRAWGGVNQNTANPGWLSDVGFGLRILNDRSSRGTVLHIDLAFPLNPDPNIKSYQYLVVSETSF